MYITSIYNIKHFIKYYNKLDYEYELNKVLMPSVYIPKVDDDGVFIILN